MHADVNVMARIRPTVTADEDDRGNVKMEEPFVPHNFPRASHETRLKKDECQGGGRGGGGGWKRERARKSEKTEEGKKIKPDRIGIAHAGALA